MSGDGEAARGAYGLRITGAGADDSWTLPVPPDWPELRLVNEGLLAGVADAEPGSGQMTGQDAEFAMIDDGRIFVDRASMTTRFCTRTPLRPDEIAHPYLALPAAVTNAWLGREVFHGGAFLHDGRAWGVLGDRAAGKSSTLARLLELGMGTVTDDLLVISGQELFAGPRTLDLREGPAERLGGDPIGLVGARERWRLRPADLDPVVALGGFVHLAWEDDVAVTPVGAAERLAALRTHRAFIGHREPARATFELIALPHWRLARPFALDRLDDAIDALLEALA